MCLRFRKRKYKGLKRFSSRLGGEILKGRYLVEKRLGKGATATVVRARDSITRDLVAIKKIERGHRVNSYIEREVLIHRALSHKNIIGFREVFLTSTHLCIVLEYASGGDLVDYMDKHGILPEDTAKNFFSQLIEAVAHCHSKGVVNRDIKLENILLQQSPEVSTIKLADFGFSKYAYDHPQTRLGTLGSIPPELLKYASRNRPYDGMKVDIWTCGVALFRMLYGRLPFDPVPTTKSSSTIFAQHPISEEEYCREVSARIMKCCVYYAPQRRVKNKTIDVSPACVQLLCGMLSKTKRRWTLSQIRESEWLSEVQTSSDDSSEHASTKCCQTEGEIRALLSRARVLATEESIFGLGPQIVQTHPTHELLVRISEGGSELSNPTTPEPSSDSMPKLVIDCASPVKSEKSTIISCTP